MRRLWLVTKLIVACVAAGVCLAGLAFPAAAGLGLLSNATGDAVHSLALALERGRPPYASILEATDGTPIAYLYDQYRLDTPSERISPNMKVAMVAIEDKRFYSHHGIDPAGTMRALISNGAAGETTQGASTLTQQYVKNYQILVTARNDKKAQEQARAVTAVRKVREARVAVELDSQLTKDEILTRYLNLVTFVGNVDGIAAGAQVFFETTPDKLTVTQAALLAGVVNNPVAYNPWDHPQAATVRRNAVLDAEVSIGKLDQDVADRAKKQPLGIVAEPRIPASDCVGVQPGYGFFCDYVRDYLLSNGFTRDQLQTGGYRIRTTVDAGLTGLAKRAVDENVPPRTPGIANTMVVIRPGSQAHEVAAMVANREYGVDAGQSMTNLPVEVSDPFGAGSIFKLFTTAAAMEQGKVGLNTQLSNPNSQCFMPPIVKDYTVCHTVQNDYVGYPDPITLENALATSPNVAFTGLELRAGLPQVLTMAYRLGLRRTLAASEAGSPPTTDPSDERATKAEYNSPQREYFNNNPSFTLGVSAVSPLELANVMATLDDGGKWCPPTPVRQLLDHDGHPVALPHQQCEQVVAPALADTMMRGLAKDTVSGTSATSALKAHWKRELAGKTGTTEYNESVGFVAGLRNYAVSSLVFADGSAPAPICASKPPRLDSDDSGCAGAFGGSLASPPFFAAFTKLLGTAPDQGLPAADPGYLDARPHGPTVPWVVGSGMTAARDTLRQAGYTRVDVTAQESNSPNGTVLGQSHAGAFPTDTGITLIVSAGHDVPR
ncbi:penicillin-binding protein [Kutzneria sp. NPDC051319]|uniref:penicillin-binding protein n=1 Tax=Kutzneria sp. NPDC051319 TaxID=3155047 RepID=UPI003426D4B7